MKILYFSKRRKNPFKDVTSHTGLRPLIDVSSAMKHVIETSQIVDTRGQYRIVHNIYGGNQAQSDSVTAVSHCSINNLYHIIDLLHYWQGPLSIALFVPFNQHIIIAQRILLTLHWCSSEFRQHAHIHLVFPLVNKPVNLSLADTTVRFECENYDTIVKLLVNSTFNNYAMQEFKYPNNLLRNAAATVAATPYIFVIDIDMVPSTGLKTMFDQFIKIFPPLSSSHLLKDTEKIVYVVPAFEMKANVDVDWLSNKEGLLKLWSSEIVQPFYYDMCLKCQKPTNFWLWRKFTDPSLYVAYETYWVDRWEPFFIAPKSMPLYDERFQQYGFNRISQVIIIIIFYVYNMLVENGQ